MSAWERDFGAGDAGTLAAGRRAGRLSLRAVDRAEQVGVLALFATLVWRLMPADLGAVEPFVWMLLLSEATVVAFVLVRRPTDRITVDPLLWVVAFLGTLAPLLVVSPATAFRPDLGLAVITAGWIIHLGAKLTLRRSFGIVPAHRGLKTDGLYAVVRHPMYAGYLVTHVGVMLAMPSIWNALIYAVGWTFLVLRMRAEEQVLSADEAYRAYRGRVRYRLVPGVW